MSANPHGDKLAPRERKRLILAAAVTLARRPGGWAGLTRGQIAEVAKCSPPLVSLRWESIDKLRRAVMLLAIREGALDIIAQGVASGYPACVKLPTESLQRALNVLMGK